MRRKSLSLVSVDPSRFGRRRLAFCLVASASLAAAAAGAQPWSPSPPSGSYAGSYGPGYAYPPPPPPPPPPGSGYGVSADAPYAVGPYGSYLYSPQRYPPAPLGQGAYGPNAYAQSPYAQSPYAQSPYAQDPHAQGPYAQGPYAQGPHDQGRYAQGAYDEDAYPPAPYGQAPYAQAPYAQAPYSQGPYAQGPDDGPADSRAGYPQNADEGAVSRSAPSGEVVGAPAYASGDLQSAARPPAGGGAPGGSEDAYAPSLRFGPPADGQRQGPPQGAREDAAHAPASSVQDPTRPQGAPAAPADLGASTSSPAAMGSSGAPPPQTAALAGRVIQSASAYLGFMARAAEISPAFKDPVSIARDLKTGASYEAHQFQEGAVAYAAIVALQEPSFVNGVWSLTGRDPGRADALAARLLADPASVEAIPGAGAAAARAGAALRRQGERLMQVGLKVKQAAYDVQRSAWSKGDIVAPAERLAVAKTLSATRSAPSRAETDRLLRLVLAEQAPAVGAQAPPSDAVRRALALAALAVMGRAGDRDADRIMPLLADAAAGECLKMAKLNLFQCMAVAGPHYEDIFCLGRHAMMDTAQCVIAASGGGTGAVMAATPAPPGYWTSASSRP